MKIFLTDTQVIELAYDALDMIQPDPDKVHDIALRMDMVYNEELDMYEDVEEVSLRKYKRKDYYSAQQNAALIEENKKLNDKVEYWIKANDSTQFLGLDAVKNCEEENKKLREALNSLVLSVKAHPDYTGEDNDEWTDLVRIAEQALLKEDIK